MTPETVSYGSQKKIWWICDRGHEWQSPPYARVGRNAGCPYCAGKKVAPGEDLRSVYPDIAAQWHPVKNGRLRPEDCLPGSSKRVWWRCIDGHEWKAAVYSRTGAKKCGCPVCAGKTPRQYL